MLRAKSHDQRKGQWLINHIRGKFNYDVMVKRVGIENLNDEEKIMVEWKLWNMENDEFDNIMREYDE